MRLKKRIDIRIGLLVAVCLFIKVGGVVSSTNLEVEKYSLTPFSWFAYNANGKYIFNATLPNHPWVKGDVKLLLLVVATQNSCKRIGKSCVYELTTIKDICTSISAPRFEEKISQAYPIIVPSDNVTMSRNIRPIIIEAKPWLEYVHPYETTLKNYISKYLAPLVHKVEVLPYLMNSGSSSGSKNIVLRITTKVTGHVVKDSYVYFSILNCFDQSIFLSLEYTFLNADGEQLSSTDIPHKVKFALTIR